MVQLNNRTSGSFLRNCRTFTFALGACLLASCSTPNPNPHRDDPLPRAEVDLPRYMGKWYNIAHIPYFGESGYVAAYSEWTLRPDGDIDDLYAARKGNFEAAETKKTFLDSVVPDSHNAEWRVRLLGPITVRQITLYVDPNYQFTLLGFPGKSLGWVFARSPDVSEADYRALLGRLDAMGYDTSRFKRVPQHREQLGLPGFLDPND